MSILEDSEMGCGLGLEELVSDGSLFTYFPVRDADVCEKQLAPRWLPWRVKSWKQPIEDVCEYFGPKIGMYFLFLGHYTTYLLPFGLVGLIVLADVVTESAESSGGLAYGLGNAKLLPFYGLFCALWGQVFLEFWKRKEATTAMTWGTSDFEENEADRVGFEGEGERL